MPIPSSDPTDHDRERLGREVPFKRRSVLRALGAGTITTGLAGCLEDFGLDTKENAVAQALSFLCSELPFCERVDYEKLVREGSALDGDVQIKVTAHVFAHKVERKTTEGQFIGGNIVVPKADIAGINLIQFTEKSVGEIMTGTDAKTIIDSLGMIDTPVKEVTDVEKVRSEEVNGSVVFEAPVQQNTYFVTVEVQGGGIAIPALVTLSKGNVGTGDTDSEDVFFGGLALPGERTEGDQPYRGEDGVFTEDEVEGIHSRLGELLDNAEPVELPDTTKTSQTTTTTTPKPTTFLPKNISPGVGKPGISQGISLQAASIVLCVKEKRATETQLKKATKKAVKKKCEKELTNSEERDLETQIDQELSRVGSGDKLGFTLRINLKGKLITVIWVPCKDSDDIESDEEVTGNGPEDKKIGKHSTATQRENALGHERGHAVVAFWMEALKECLEECLGGDFGDEFDFGDLGFTTPDGKADNPGLESGPNDKDGEYKGTNLKTHAQERYHSSKKAGKGVPSNETVPPENFEAVAVQSVSEVMSAILKFLSGGSTRHQKIRRTIVNCECLKKINNTLSNRKKWEKVHDSL